MNFKAAASAAKSAAVKVGSGKVLAAGGTVAAFAGRRALWPGFVVGGAFSSAAWFGVFEITWSMTKLAMPVPKEPDSGARVVGIVSIPVVTGGSLLLGHKLAPAVAAPPTSIIDLPGLFGFARSLPLKHYAVTGATSAVAAAVCCRVVQYHGGA